MDINSKVQAVFQLEILDKNLNKKINTVEFPNIVLNQGLERLGYGEVFSYCRVGTGSSVPDKTQTQLDNQRAATSNVEAESSGINASGGYIWFRKKFRFGAGVASGNLTEVGVGWNDNDTNTLFNRALIRDTQNNPTTVTVLNDEVLDVTVELRSYVSLLPTTSSVTISGTVYELKIQSLLSIDSAFNIEYYCTGATGYSGQIGTYSSGPTGRLDDFGVTNQPYAPGSLKRTFDLYWGLNQGNAAPLKTVVCWTPYCAYQVEYSPAIPKTSETVLRLTQEITWGRYE